MAGKKPQIPPDTVAALRAISLWDYIETSDRAAWRKIGRHYFNVEHDSLCVSENGKWHWQSRGEGGTTALDYLMLVKGLCFYDALITLQKAQLAPAITLAHYPETPAIGLMLPPAHSNNHVVIRYLMERGISKDIIHTCIAAGYLYQSHEQGGGMTFHTAFFTMGGATPEEINYNRRMNYAALQGGKESMLEHIPEHDNAPYGMIMAEFHQNGEDGIFYVMGTKENGYYVTKDYAAKMLSPAAMRYAVPMGDDAFYFSDVSAKPVLFHELPSSQFFADIKPRERKELVHKLFEQFPEYTKARGLTPPQPAKRRKSPDAPQR